ncbi:MATE family efflux transporter [Haematomicrobium sanguinis]|uniref:MATE family efflux transporter n=1 Tax=Haematomicrobium sanguinis TaxID=479106 RepID=UPI00047C3C3C|nr:MATE family efflux transporter [Haematomicrobium sanguinis]
MSATTPKRDTPQNSQRGLGRQILALALPALGALIAEPLFLLADTAIVGHLGVDELAGVGLASTLVQTAVGLLIFLAYSVTPAVGRAFGAGLYARASAAGRDGLWLAFLLGVAIALIGWALAPQLLALMGAGGAVQGFGIDYLRWSMPGIPAMLLVLAGTGALRGWQDGKTPLLVAGIGFTANIGLNFALVYGFNLSVAGSAIGTSIAQWGMAAVYLVILTRRHRHHEVGWRPSLRGVIATAHIGGYLMLRTVTLRAALIIMVYVATSQGAVVLAAHQLVLTIFTFLAFALDALAIAAQSLVSKELGAARTSVVKELIAKLCWWGAGAGVVTGVILATVAPWVGFIFTSDRAVIDATTAGLWVLAAAQPLCGIVFVLDGILIGAQDARYLALVGLANLAVFVVTLWILSASGLSGVNAVVGLWIAFSVAMMAARAVTLGLRVRGERWMVLGAGN